MASTTTTISLNVCSICCCTSCNSEHDFGVVVGILLLSTIDGRANDLCCDCVDDDDDVDVDDSFSFCDSSIIIFHSTCNFNCSYEPNIAPHIGHVTSSLEPVLESTLRWTVPPPQRFVLLVFR